MPQRGEYNVVILGSGPAGLTAAIYASRASLEPLVIEGGGSDQTDLPGGQLMLTTDVDNYPGFPEGVVGPELMDGMRQQATRFGTEFATGLAENVDLSQRPFSITLADEAVIRARTLIVATGARAKWLNLPEEMAFRTQIGGVSACATCDGFFYKGKEVLVVGGGDTAMEEALHLTKFATKVTVVHRRDQLRASKIMQERARANERIAWLLDSVIEKILGGPGAGVTGALVRNVKSGNVSEIEAQGIFMAIGHEPNTAFLGGQLELDAARYIVTRGRTSETSVAGVFAAGDVADARYRQAVTAAGSGCMAALDAERYLGEHD